MEPHLQTVLEFLRSKGARAGDGFQISLFFELTDGVEIQAGDVIAALDLAVQRGLVKPVKGMTPAYRLTAAGFDAMHAPPADIRDRRTAIPDCISGVEAGA